MRKWATIFLLAMVLAGGSAWAQTWDETVDGGGDAGIQNASQLTTGMSGLTTISGAINTGAGDHVDCYVITVETAMTFYATTDPSIDANAVVGDTDTRLWIWDATGTTVISANDDSPSQPGLLSIVADPAAVIPGSPFVAVPTAPVTDSLMDGMQYTLCYSYFANDPEDAGAIDLVNLGTFEALNGPDPAAGAFSSYEDPNAEGFLPYTIAFGSAQTSDFGVAGPGALPIPTLGGTAMAILSLLLIAGALMVLRRSRRVA